MSSVMIGIICIIGMLLLIGLRAPIALAMSLTGFVGVSWIIAFKPAASLLETGPFEALSQYSYSPIPMFILMGAFASKAKMSEHLFNGARILFGGWRGGIALSAICSCGLFSALSGSSIATAASMAKVALPEMKKSGYAPSLATGALAAGGTIGIMIPPSIALLLYALLTEQSVNDLFLAGLLPGILGVFLYCATIAITVYFYPHLAEPSPKTTLKQKITGCKGIIPFGGIVTLIIGGIYVGLFTPTEAAAVGAFGTLIIALYRGLRWHDFIDAITETLAISSMIFFMIMGAQIFGYFLSVSRLSYELVDYVRTLHLSPYALLACILGLFIVLGMIMDSIAMLLLTVPVVYPLIIEAGFNPIWFGIIVVITVELGLITPPIGLNVFVIKSVSPETDIKDIFKGVIPFIISDLIRLGLIISYPMITLGLLQS